jgi:diaminohydroxyphosphoribosylaminopyrimidine deaminase/5-amino-6-(5-phosphoribosylamino)uracil reductase
LIAAGVARVVAAMPDSDSRVSGKGFEMLRNAGIEVATGQGADEAVRDHSGFFLRVEQGRPHVTLKLAVSLDGRIATATGESQWITGPEARRVVHGLRATHDAVMVGAGTARADDPALTVRGFGDLRQPVRVVVSRLIDIPFMSQLARTAQDVPVWVCHGEEARKEIVKAWQGLGARLLPCRVVAGRVDPLGLLQALGAEGITRVFCEGGGQLASALLSAGLVDELHVFSAGMALGAEGYPALGAMGVSALTEAPRLQLARVSQVGSDLHHVWEKI